MSFFGRFEGLRVNPVSAQAAARRGAWILGAALFVHALLFVRVAVLFAPDLYLGPSGADRVFYYAYVRSLVVDGDLDFRNEIALRPPSSGVEWRDGRALNKYPIGAPLLALPAYAATHAAVLGARAAGWSDLRADGYGRPYALTYALAQLGWASLGFVLLYRIGRRYFAPPDAATGVAAAIFATPLLLYTAADLMMSHAASSFAAAWCLHECLRARDEPERPRRWFALGVASALVVLVRLQNVVYLIAPTLVLWRSLPRGRRAAAALAGAAVGAGLLLVPQGLVWHSVYGTFAVNPYSTEFRFDWSALRLGTVLYEASSLGRWLPVLAVALAGSVGLARSRRDGLIAASAAGTFAAIWVAAAWSSPGVASRSAFDNLAIVSLGLTSLAASGRWRWSWLGPALLMALAVWNVPFVVAGAMGSWSEVVDTWWRGVRYLL